MPLSLADVLAALSQKQAPQPDNSVAQAAQLAQAPQGGDPVAQAAQIAQAPQPQGAPQPTALPPQTLHGQALASLAQMQPSVDPTVGGTAPQANDSMPQATPDLGGGSGSGGVPQFQAAPDVASHASWLHNALQSIGHGVQRFSQAYGDRLANIDPATAAMMTPDQIQHARQQALFQDGLGTLDRQPDARGFMPSTLQSIARGMQQGNQAGQQAAQGSLQANQQATQIRQQQALVTGRQQIAKQFAWDPSDSTDMQLQKLDGSAQAYLGLGDYHAADAAAQAAKSLREGRTAANGSASPYAQINAGDIHTTFRKADGMYLQRDGKTWAPSIDVQETPFHRDETARRAADAEQNTQNRELSAYQTQFVKPYTKPAAAIASWNGIYPQAQTKPEATKAAITAFVGAMEPNVQLRYATLQYLSTVDPSLAGRIRTMISSGTYGVLPANQLEEMNQVVQAKAGVYKSQYENSATQGQKMYPTMIGRAQRWEDLTGQRNAAAPGTSSAGAPIAHPANPF